MIFNSIRFAVILTTIVLARGQNTVPEKLPSYTILKSLILPGWGNYELGNKSIAYTHFSSELILWSGYFYTDKLANEQMNNVEAMSIEKLGLEKQSYTASYYKIIASYNSYDEYIEFQRRQGNSISTDLSEELRWNWSSEKDRQRFNSKRIEALETEKEIDYWIYGMILNRVMSFFTTRRDRKRAFSAFTQASYHPKTGNKIVTQFSIHF